MNTLVITGASSGIGAETARHAWRAGWSLVLGARREERLVALAEELQELQAPAGDQQVHCVGCDVREWADNERLAEVAVTECGGINAVFANAGFGAPRGFLESDPEHWKDMILTNVYGCALTIRATLPALQESRGHMVITSSVAGRRVLPGSLYSASKWAVTAMGEALRQEVADSGVRVTLIEPGMTDTPFFDDGVPEWSLTSEDVARSVMFALEQPPGVDLAEIMIRPTGQVT